MSAAPAVNQQQDKTPAQLTVSQKFLQKVERQFVAEMGSGVAWTSLQAKLAQHLYVKIDQALTAAEVKRSSQRNNDNPPITWANVNMQKLSLDAVHRVNLELDALIPNHIHVIPYLNSRTKLYELDLRIGYMGSDHVRRKFAIDIPLDIRYELVHEDDKFDYGRLDGVEWVEFKRANPFKPGEVIGGFGYITYEDPRKNRVVLVEYREFEKAMNANPNVEFWGGIQKVWSDKDRRKVDGEFDEKFRKEMQFKTVVHRVCNKIPLDPAKVNGDSLEAIRASETESVILEMEAIEMEHGNKQVVPFDPASDLQVQEGEIIPEHEHADESETPAATEPQAEQYDIAELRAKLKLTEDLFNHVQENLGERTGAFLAGLVGKARSVQQIKDAVKVEIGLQEPATEEGPGY